MISRRDSLKWMLATAALAASARTAMAETAAAPAAASLGPIAPWPVVDLPAITAPGYGTDPDTMNPTVPWPLTLSPEHRTLINTLGDLILPADELSKGAGENGIAAFFDEWISAPYPNQQSDRPGFIALLLWLDAQSRLMSGRAFSDAGEDTQTRILDALIANTGVPPEAGVFDWFRVLMIFGYYSLPENLATAGLAPEDPIIGPYPGPSDEAMTHLNALLVSLNLTPYA